MLKTGGDATAHIAYKKLALAIEARSPAIGLALQSSLIAAARSAV
jgi:hypothetical protein